MAKNKKRSVQEEDGNNTNHGADAKKHKQVDGYVLSKHEDMLLSIDNVKILPRSAPRYLKPMMAHHVAETFSFIRPAYCSVRTTDMVKLFKDKTTINAVMALANMFRKMRRFSLCMRALRTDLLTKLELPLQSSDKLPTSGISTEECSNCKLIHPQVSLTHPRGSGQGDCNLVDETGEDQFSKKVRIKVRTMLLLLDEMLIQMGVDPENVQGMVKHRMILLRTEMEQEESLLIKLIDSNCGSEYASFCDKRRDLLVHIFCFDARSCNECVLSANKEKHPSLHKVSEFICGMFSNWHSDGRTPIPNEQGEILFQNQLKERLSSSRLKAMA